MSKRFYTIFLSVLIAIFLGFILMTTLSSLKPEEVKLKPEIPVRYVTAEIVKYQDIKTSIKNAGRVATAIRVNLSSEVQGIARPGDVGLRKGESFAKGQLLVKIENPEVELSLKSSKSRFMTSLANTLADIQIDYNNEYQKWGSFFQKISVDEPLPKMPKIENEQFKIFLASKNILGDYYSIQSQEVRLAKHFLYAPFKGSFASVNLQESSVVNPGSVIGSLINTSNYEIEVPVIKSDAKWLNMGQKVHIYPEDSNDTIVGKIVRIADFIDPQTQSIPVFVSMNKNRHSMIYEGSYFDCEFENITVEESMEVPRSIVFNHNEVFIVKDGRLRKKEINILKLNEQTLYFNGLTEGEWLVNEALINANENMEVEIIDQMNK